MISARAIAARVVERVDRDRAFAAAALDAELARYPQLDARERGFATELAYGTLRTRRALFVRLEKHAPKGLAKTDRSVLSALLVAAYQILVLDRVPAHAAVDAAVEQARAMRGERLGGFANALLRKLAASGERERDVGPAEASALLAADPSGLPIAVRVRIGRPEPEWLAHAERGRASPLARLLKDGGDLRRRPGYDAGEFVIQEEGAQLVAFALGARAGERILDACAGRGQKTSLLSEQLAGSGELWACDVHPKKLEALIAEHERLGQVAPKIEAIDWTRGSGSVPGDFDRVLVDAPCTGTGTLRRRPEMAERLTPEDPARLSELAERILRAAARRARPGGRIVYAVCSVFREEAEAIVERVADELVPVPFDSPELCALAGRDATSLRLLPLCHGTDGYFVASFCRREL